jgi:hypothetical protein
MTDTPSPGRTAFRSLMGWLADAAGCTWPSGWPAADDEGEDAGNDGMPASPVIDQQPKPIESMRVPARTPKDLEGMRKTAPEGQAKDFHRLLNAVESGEKGDQELLALAKAVGWLHTTKCLPALQAVLAGIGTRDAASRPVLVKALAEQLSTFPPQDEDYEEPTADQGAALEALLQATADHVVPDQWADMLSSLREALGAACGGMDWYMGDLTPEAAVAMTQGKPTDMAPFLARLEALAAMPTTPQGLQGMGRTEAQAEQFYRLLRANSAKPDGEGTDDRLALAKAVGWLHTEKCLPALQAVLDVAATRADGEQPALLVTLAGQLSTFPPQDEDYEEPTADQAAALEALLQAMTGQVTPDRWADVLSSLREALGAACGGMDWYMGDLSLEQAVARTKSGPRDMTPFLERLEALAAMPTTPPSYDDSVPDVPPPSYPG